MYLESQIEKRERENGPEHKFEEITPGNFQILWENFNLQIQDFNELQIVKEPKHITVKFLKGNQVRSRLTSNYPSVFYLH